MDNQHKGRPAPPYYTRDDLPEWIGTPGAQHPGTFPFLRGIHPEMYTSRAWRMRQYAGFGTPTDTNRRWRTLIAQGQDGISCAFDLPTQVGFDADDPRARTDAGRLGVSINTLDDFVALFEDIPLDHTAATFNINATAPVIYAMLLETVHAQGVDPAKVQGSLSNDPLIEYIARGLWRLPPVGALRLMADTFEYSLQHTPNFYPMNLRGTLVYEAGGSAVQEIAFALGCAQAYLDALAERGVDLDAAARRFSFLFFSDSNFLEEAAKFRAVRTLWAEMVKERYAVVSPSGQRLRFTAAVGNFNLRAQMPELNLVRNTLGALGAALGGCQSMLVAGMDEAFEIPSERSSLIGLYTQQIIALESHITRSVDPLGGSYFVEQHTKRLADDIVDLLRRLTDHGVVAAIEDGTLQREVADSAFDYQLAEESGALPVVGVNTPGSKPPEDPEFELHLHDDARMAAQSEALDRHRAGRDRDAVELALDQLRETLAGEDNAIPAIRAALRAGATVGEIMAAGVECYGEYVEPVEA